MSTGTLTTCAIMAVLSSTGITTARRLHSALGYVSPAAFEKASEHSGSAAARMSFIRHEEI